MGAPAPGHVVAGKYRLIALVGHGGMGSVWRGIHLSLDMPVAVKFMGAHASDPESRARFDREGRALATLRSPNIVQVLDHGLDAWGDGQADEPYIVMEYLEGEDLGARLAAQKRLSLTDTHRILAQAARGLRRAHEAGILHRDLKPSNIFLAHIDGEEIVKLLDFGVAKLETPNAKLDEALTRAGTLLGSPGYMSPEQARGKTIDHRSDLWALAVILFRAVTGTKPFAGDSIAELIVKLCFDPRPQATRIAPDLPVALDGFFEKAFAAEPADRFGSAPEMAAAFAIACGISPEGSRVGAAPAGLAGLDPTQVLQSAGPTGTLVTPTPSAWPASAAAADPRSTGPSGAHPAPGSGAEGRAAGSDLPRPAGLWVPPAPPREPTPMPRAAREPTPTPSFGGFSPSGSEAASAPPAPYVGASLPSDAALRPAPLRSFADLGPHTATGAPDLSQAPPFGPPPSVPHGAWGQGSADPSHAPRPNDPARPGLPPAPTLPFPPSGGGPSASGPWPATAAGPGSGKTRPATTMPDPKLAAIAAGGAALLALIIGLIVLSVRRSAAPAPEDESPQIATTSITTLASETTTSTATEDAGSATTSDADDAGAAVPQTTSTAEPGTAAPEPSVTATATVPTARTIVTTTWTRTTTTTKSGTKSGTKTGTKTGTKSGTGTKTKTTTTTKKTR